MNLSQKLPLAFASALILTLSAGSGGLWMAGRALDTFQSDVQGRMADERATAALESAFKTQVQEWKNTLLRGMDSALMDKHWRSSSLPTRKWPQRTGQALKNSRRLDWSPRSVTALCAA